MEKLRLKVQKTEINGRGGPMHGSRGTLYLEKLALTSSRSGGRSVGIVSLLTKATEFKVYAKKT
jgi:hypothetical protein